MPREMHWFRTDLRLFDNPSLYAAAQQADEGLLTCFFICAEQWRQHDMAPIQAEFIRANLASLSAELQSLGIPLLIEICERFDEVPQRLFQLLETHQCQGLHFNEEYPVNERKRDAQVARLLRQHQFGVYCYQDQCVVAPGQLKTQAGKPYTVFTPFRRAWQVYLEQFWPQLWPVPSAQAQLPCPPSPVPAHIEGFSQTDLQGWRAGEQAAQDILERFVHQGLLHYRSQRDFPSLDGTSRLSPYLALGVLSPRQAVLAAYQAREEYPGQTTEIETWIHELVWRDFYIHILDAFPQVSRHQPFKAETKGIAWRDDEAGFRAWCEGRTGIPIVDAAMRQLNQTGWMHNRLRMVTAMFLSKNLLIDWRRGERYFAQNLIDCSLAANNGGWQWSASTGTDAAPYFRVFNPVSQGEKFDPQGEFVRRFVPELKARSQKLLHQPLTAEELRLGLYDYPPAIVDLKSSRERAIAAFRSLRPDPPQDYS